MFGRKASGAFGDDEPRTLIEQTTTRLRDDTVEGSLLTSEKFASSHLNDRYEVGAGALREATRKDDAT